MSIILLSRISQYINNSQIIKRDIKKHWNPKWKRLRAQKVIKVDLLPFTEKKPDDDDDADHISSSERRQKMKERGIFPQKPWMEKPMYISHTGTIFEPYVPPEGDGKFSPLSSSGAKQNMEFLMKKTKSYREYRKIRKYEEEFDANEFPEQALEIYKTAHTLLAEKKKDEIQKYITEKLYPEMYCNLENKRIIWRFLKSLEPARIVHARTTTLISDTNVFAQVTVRFHSQQSLAVYDRFGRLINGSEILTKDVLDYIVFEKHISNEYGLWRMHGKIVPPWMPMQYNLAKTFTVSPE